MKKQCCFYKGVLLLVCGLVLQVYPLPSGLMAYYSFDNDVIDHSSHGNNGTSYNNPVWMQGHVNQGMYFNGSTDFVTVPNSASLAITDQLTLSAWIKPEAGHYWYRIVGKANSGSSDNDWVLGVALSGGIYFAIWKGGAQYSIDGQNDLILNEWNHVAGVWDGSIIRVYWNGALQSETVAVSPPVNSSPSPLIIGKKPDNSYFFKGTIDEVMVFNRALSANEVKSLYTNTTTSLSYKFLIPVPSPSYNRQPVFHWHHVPLAGSYLLQVDTSITLANPVIKIPLTDTTYKVSTDLPVGALYWQVIAGVNDTLHYNSEIGSFIIQDPQVPILVPYLPKITLERRPGFAWHPVTGAASYMLQVCSSNNFGNLIQMSSLTDTISSTTADIPIGPVFWRVKSNLVNAWSAVDSFQIQSDSVPFLIRFNGVTVKSIRPVFTWKKVPKATNYRIEMADNPGFTNILAGTVVTDTTFCLAADLKPDTWYWRVSCDRNYSLFPLPDSLVTESPTGIRAGPVVRSAFPRQMLSGGTACEVSVYTLTGSRIATLHMVHTYKSIHEFINASGIKCAKNVYILEMKKDGILQLHETFLNH
jgi:hypothetical protein